MKTFLPKEIELWDIARLAANPNNTRKHSAGQIEELRRSMAAFGFMAAVVADSDGVILAGNARVEAAKALGLKCVPVIAADHLTESQKKAFAIADNQIALHATWDDELLKVELELLKEGGMDLKLVGFSDEEFTKLVDALEAEIRSDDEDAAPALAEIAISKASDEWEMGEHRLICGDATAASTYQQLLGDQPADMVFVDLPYNVAYQAPLASDGSVRHASITNDDLGTGFGEFLAVTCGNIIAHTAGAIYICMSSSELHTLYTAFTQAGGHWSTFIIWTKMFTLGRSDYQRAFEPILYGWPEGKSHHWCGARDQSDVWEIDRVHRCDLHPTMKPVELVERAIRNSSKLGDVVLDPFAGSGTTVIACEKARRRARVAELEPAYCDVIVKRWQEFTGNQAIHQTTKKTFAEMGELRLGSPNAEAA